MAFSPRRCRTPLPASCHGFVLREAEGGARGREPLRRRASPSRRSACSLAGGPLRHWSAGFSGTKNSDVDLKFSLVGVGAESGLAVRVVMTVSTSGKAFAQPAHAIWRRRCPRRATPKAQRRPQPDMPSSSLGRTQTDRAAAKAAQAKRLAPMRALMKQSRTSHAVDDAALKPAATGAL